MLPTFSPNPMVSFLIQKQTGSHRNDLVLKVVQTEQMNLGWGLIQRLLLAEIWPTTACFHWVSSK